MRDGDRVALCIIAEGTPDPSRFESVERLLGGIEVVSAPDKATTQAAVLNPLVDESQANWILVLRQGERVSDELAVEIARDTTHDSRAWGYRISVRRLYCGLPLALGGRDPGSVRLFHRRKARLQSDGRMKVQGTVVRLRSAIDLVVYESEESHVEGLQADGAERVSAGGRLVRWVADSVRNGPRSFSRPTRRYLWIEASWRRPS